MNYLQKSLMMIVFLMNTVASAQLKSDKEFLQKIKDIQNNQLQKLINFTPGFKIALKSFFDYNWQQAAEKVRKKETQEEVKKVTIRLQEDFKNLNLDELVGQLKQLGDVNTVKQSNKGTKQHFSDLLQEIKKAENNVYSALKPYEKKAKENLSWLLQFSALTPAPYKVWMIIYETIETDHDILVPFIEVVKTLIEKGDNKRVVQEYESEAQTKLDKLKTHYASFKSAVVELLSVLRKKLEADNVDALINKAAENKTNMYQSLNSLHANLSALDMYYLYMADTEVIKKWQDLIAHLQKMIVDLTAMQQQWRQQFESMVSRHRNIYDFVNKKRSMQEINKNFDIEEPMITNISSLLQELQTNLISQKNLAATDK